MTIYAFSTENSLPTPITLDSYDQVMIGSTAMVLAFSDHAFTSGVVNDVSITVQGYLGAWNSGFQLGTLGFSSNVVFNVGSSGTIDAYNAILLSDTSAMINNAGLISGVNSGISFNDVISQSSYITNSGTIHGKEMGISLMSMGSSTFGLPRSGGPVSVLVHDRSGRYDRCCRRSGSGWRSRPLHHLGGWGAIAQR